MVKIIFNLFFAVVIVIFVFVVVVVVEVELFLVELLHHLLPSQKQADVIMLVKNAPWRKV